MSRHAFVLFSVLLISVVFGCGGRHDGLMRARMAVIDSLNRHYQPFSIDSVEEIARYFDTHGTSHDRAMAYYLLGSAYRDAGEAPAALNAFQHAIEQADTTDSTCDYRLLAKIHAQMGYLFQREYQPHAAREQFLLAARWSLMQKDTLNYYIARQAAMHSLKTLNLTDSLLLESQEIYDGLCAINRPDKAALTLSSATRVYIERHQLVKAKQLLDIYREHADTTSPQGRRQYTSYQYLFGEYYLYAGRPDSAEWCFRYELAHGRDISDRVCALRGLFHLYSQTGYRDSLVKYTAAYHELNDSSNIMRESEAILAMKSLYDYSRHVSVAAEKTIEVKDKQFWLLLVSTLSAVLLCALFWYIYMVKRRNQKSLQQQTIRYHELMSDYHRLKGQLDEFHSANAVLEQCVSDKEDELEKLQQRLQSMQEGFLRMSVTPIEEASVYRRVSERARKGKAAYVEDLLSLNGLVELSYPSYSEKIHSFPYQMTQTEQNVCMLIKTGFKTSDIAVMLGYTPPAVSNIKTRLLVKLFNKKMRADDLDRMVLGEW